MSYVSKYEGQEIDDILSSAEAFLTDPRIYLEDILPTLTLKAEAYPIGSFYISSSSVSPASLFGGTWEQIKDRFLLSAGDTYTNGSTGGETEHLLTINEMPSHKHLWKGNNGITTSTGAGMFAYFGNDDNSTVINTGKGPQLAGGDVPHNNMPPYLVAYIWKRIN